LRTQIWDPSLDLLPEVFVGPQRFAFFAFFFLAFAFLGAFFADFLADVLVFLLTFFFGLTFLATFFAACGHRLTRKVGPFGRE
jgi:hypothetical protein